MIDYADGALELHTEGPVATLRLNRPAARNALNLAMWRALPDVVAAVADDASLRVLIVRGAGGHFASGADIAEFDQVFADHGSALAYGRLIETATASLANLKKPVMAVVEGFCIGAGLAIALACDMRLAADTARFCAPPAKLGLIYSLADTRRLVLAVGPSRARIMLFSAEQLNAPEALRLGLIDEAYAPDALDAAAGARALAMAAQSLWSIRHAKAILARVLNGAHEDTDETRGWFADAPMGEDFAEGLAAFRERRPPKFR